jgi:hypothetical protein
MIEAAADMSPVKPGDVLAGRYRIERVLGVGGMGLVVAARHIQLDDLVAIKFLLPQALQNPEVVARFAREARAAVKIKNEHVARVLDVGSLENGAPYMIMEYLQGCDLSELIHSRGRLAIPEAADFILQASEAIAEAHSLGIVHRDLKPGNLFLVTRPDGGYTVKVLDFGISKSTAMSGSGPSAMMTRTASILGSPLYMSPEQMSSPRDVDARADVWALGIILHEILTGQVPFEADTMPQLCLKIVQEPPPPLRMLCPEAPPALEAVVQRCLEKDRNRRFANIAEFALALADFAPPRCRISAERAVHLVRTAGGQIRAATTNITDGRDGRTVVATTNSAWGQATTPPARKGGRAIALFGGALLLVAAGAIVLLRTGRENAASSTSGTEASNTQSGAQPQLTANLPPQPTGTDKPAAAAPSSAEPISAAPSASGAGTRPPEEAETRPGERLPTSGASTRPGARPHATAQPSQPRGTKGAPTFAPGTAAATGAKPETTQPGAAQPAATQPASPAVDNGWEKERR